MCRALLHPSTTRGVGYGGFIEIAQELLFGDPFLDGAVKYDRRSDLRMKINTRAEIL